MSGLYQAIEDVAHFHVATDTPILPTPQWPADERIDLRVSLIVEEVTKELLPAIARRDMIETADAILDSIYVLIGAGLEFGIPMAEIWASIQRSNMAKAVEQPDGTFKVIKRPDSKILKPADWVAPDVEGILREHGWKG